MRHIFEALCLLCLILVATAQCQVATSDKRRAIIVPSEVILPVAAAQPDCPLKFKEVGGIVFLDGGSGDFYLMQNQGTKAIRSYTVAAYDSFGGYWWRNWPGDVAHRPLLAGEVQSEEDDLEIIPLTETLRDKLKLRGPMRGISVFMVTRVEFEDGTTYNYEATKKALAAYFDLVASKVP